MELVKGSKVPIQIPSKVKMFFKAINRYKYLYIMALPGILFYLVFSYGPMYGIILAFKKFMYNSSIWDSPWVGLDNFKFLFNQPDFWNAFKNTIVISFGKILFGFPAPIILALLLNELKNKYFKKTVQSILYMPHFLSWIIVYGIFYSLFSSNSGIIPKVLSDFFSIGFPNIISESQYFRPIIYLSDVWKGAGWGTIIYLAAITGISPELYESAHLDGANRLQRAWYITLPSLKYAIVILLILSFGSVMDAGFDQIFNFYSPATYEVGDILDTYIYRLGVVGSRFDISTAVGLFKSVINMFLLLAADRLAKLMGEEGLF